MVRVARLKLATFCLEGRHSINWVTLALSTLIIWSVFWKFQAILKICCIFSTGFSINRYWLKYGADGRIRTCEAFALIYDTSPVDHLGNVGIKRWRRLFTAIAVNMERFSGISSDFENLSSALVHVDRNRVINQRTPAEIGWNLPMLNKPFCKHLA